MWAAWSCANPHQSQETMETAVNMKVFSVSHWVREIIGSGKGGSIWPGATSGSIWVGFILVLELSTRPGNFIQQMFQASQPESISECARVGPSLGRAPQRGLRYFDLFWGGSWGHVMHMEVQVTSRVAQLEKTSHQVGPSGDTTWGTLIDMKRHQCPTKVGNTGENGRFEDSVLGRPNRSNLGPSCTMLEPKLEPSGSKWAEVVGRSWPQVEPIETVHSDDVLPICKMRKLPHRANMGPPAEAVPVWQICPIGSTASPPSAWADFNEVHHMSHVFSRSVKCEPSELLGELQE